VVRKSILGVQVEALIQDPDQLRTFIKVAIVSSQRLLHGCLTLRILVQGYLKSSLQKEEEQPDTRLLSLTSSDCEKTSQPPQVSPSQPSSSDAPGAPHEEFFGFDSDDEAEPNSVDESEQI